MATSPTTQCRYALPRPQAAAYCFTADSHLQLQRELRMLSSFIPSLLLARPCNQNFACMLEISRHLHNVWAWSDVQRQAGTTADDEPDPPGTALQAAVDQALYCLK
jgi:hypothetical protein